jgi:hypothetical protein
MMHGTMNLKFILPMFGNKFELEVCRRYLESLGGSVANIMSLFVDSLRHVTS